VLATQCTPHSARISSDCAKSVFRNWHTSNFINIRTRASVTAGMMMNRMQLQWCEHYYQSCQLNGKPASTRKHLRGLGKACSSATLQYRVAYINF